jgi:phosphoserine phosphatase RsbU/P
VPTVADQEAEERLRRIASVTDSSLARLDSGQLLDELLGRVRGSLRVDTATVLLADETGHQLTAVASAGIAEEVHQGVRVPVGRGFAGRVAAERRPVTIDHVDNATVVNPLLWERGLRTLLGVPLLVEGRLVGVLHVGRVQRRLFTDDEVQLLQMVADRIALVVRSQMTLSERSAVTALQQSLLPTVLPVVPGVEFAARYVPGADTGFGGDWYDVFPLPDDRVGVVIGDVVGSGLAAAVVMGRLRSALRAYALDVDDPAQVLRKLDRKAHHFEYGTMATVCYAVVDASRDWMTLALAGHPPPAIVAPGTDAVFTQPPIGPPIGFAGGGGHYADSVVGLPQRAVVCFYTDGLVERRGSPIDDGLDLLLATVEPGAPEMVCARVMAALVGTRAASDDVAVVAMRRIPDCP